MDRPTGDGGGPDSRRNVIARAYSTGTSLPHVAAPSVTQGVLTTAAILAQRRRAWI